MLITNKFIFVCRLVGVKRTEKIERSGHNSKSQSKSYCIDFFPAHKLCFEICCVSVCLVSVNETNAPSVNH